MQTIKVAKVESKPTKNGGTLTIIEDEKGSRFSGFDTELTSVKSGSTIEADIKVDGKYNNITAFHVIQEAPAGTPQVPVNPPAGEDQGKRQSIEFQTALTEAGESLRAGLIAKDSPIAHLYYGALTDIFIRQGVKPAYMEQPPPKAQSAPSAAQSVQTPPAVSGPDLLTRYKAIADKALGKGYTGAQLVGAWARQKPPVKVIAVNSLGEPDFTVLPDGITEAQIKTMEVIVNGAKA